MTPEIIALVRREAERLRDKHFASAHTDMIGDAEERYGYLKGIAALEKAICEAAEPMEEAEAN